MRLFTLIAVATLLVAGSVARAEPGDPIPGTEVGLEGEPEWTVAVRPSDRRGNVVFVGLGPGRYTVFVPDASRLRAPVRIRINANLPAPEGQDYSIQPGRGRAYALDADGRRLVVTVPRAGGRISVNVSSIFDRWGRQGDSRP
ncbi:MAG: hypothetical protein PSV23_13840 [Brevundimonas sp.]|uniref:hypothetical protein n=1 Tax=Brevundimonas sp. TaxID=1871086 RepID=UPI002489CA99|nr:hypothetical protein [Brevundimonas sp.]MDI1327866.1 hypothetical protein [Brevundimonas sp.]